MNIIIEILKENIIYFDNFILAIYKSNGGALSDLVSKCQKKEEG